MNETVVFGDNIFTNTNNGYYILKKDNYVCIITEETARTGTGKHYAIKIDCNVNEGIEWLLQLIKTEEGNNGQ